MKAVLLALSPQEADQLMQVLAQAPMPHQVSHPLITKLHHAMLTWKNEQQALEQAQSATQAVSPDADAGDDDADDEQRQHVN